MALPAAITPSVRPVQCRSPSDPPNGSSTRPFRRPASLGITTLANASSHRNTSRRQASAVRRWRAAKQPHETGCGVPCSHLPTGAATALQASSNTYPTGFTTTATKNCARGKWPNTRMNRNDACTASESAAQQARRGAGRRGPRSSGNPSRAWLFNSFLAPDLQGGNRCAT